MSESLEAPSTSPAGHVSKGDLESGAVFERLAEWLPAFLDTIATAASEPTADGQSAAALCTELGTIHAKLQSMRPRRPFVAILRCARQVTEVTRSAVKEYIEAFSADTPLAAQDHAARAQELVDMAGELSAELGSRLDSWNRIQESDNPAAVISGLLAEARSRTGAAGLIELEAAGAERFEALTGDQCPIGTGIALQSLAPWVDAMLDDAHFEQTLGSAYQVIVANIDRLRELLSDDTVLADLRTGWTLLIDQQLATAAVVAVAKHERQHLAEALKLAHTMFEGPGRRLGLMLLDLIGQETFTPAYTGDGAWVLGQVQQQPALAGLLEGMDRSARIAHAHQSFTYSAGQLTLHLRTGASVVDPDDLLDTLLAGQESLTAVGLALSAAANGHLGVDVFGQQSLDDLGITTVDKCAFVLVGHGYAVDDISLTRATMSIAATGPRLTADAIGAVISTVPKDISVVKFTRQDSEDTEEWRLSVPTLRKVGQQPDDFSKQLALVEGLSRSTRNGQRVMSEAQVRRWVVNSAHQHDESASRSIGLLRTLRDLARQLDDQELEAGLTKWIRWHRLNVTGDLTPDDDTELTSILTAWLASSVYDPLEL